MYKGDLSPREAYERLLADPSACLIDVRTDAEWAFVGVAAVDRMYRISWQRFPMMERDVDFAEKVKNAGVSVNEEIFLLCRSGVRSAAAAAALTEAGFANCYNVAEGFEGDRDESGHRGNLGGWKHAGLPWAQG